MHLQQALALKGLLLVLISHQVVAQPVECQKCVKQDPHTCGLGYLVQVLASLASQHQTNVIDQDLVDKLKCMLDEDARDDCTTTEESTPTESTTGEPTTTTEGSTPTETTTFESTTPENATISEPTTTPEGITPDNPTTVEPSSPAGPGSSPGVTTPGQSISVDVVVTFVRGTLPSFLQISPEDTTTPEPVTPPVLKIEHFVRDPLPPLTESSPKETSTDEPTTFQPSP